MMVDMKKKNCATSFDPLPAFPMALVIHWRVQEASRGDGTSSTTTTRSRRRLNKKLTCSNVVVYSPLYSLPRPFIIHTTHSKHPTEASYTLQHTPHCNSSILLDDCAQCPSPTTPSTMPNIIHIHIQQIHGVPPAGAFHRQKSISTISIVLLTSPSHHVQAAPFASAICPHHPQAALDASFARPYGVLNPPAN